MRWGLLLATGGAVCAMMWGGRERMTVYAKSKKEKQRKEKEHVIYTPILKTTWDNNWDMRQPIIEEGNKKGKKEKDKSKEGKEKSKEEKEKEKFKEEKEEKEKSKEEKKVEELKPTAIRHLVLIRHGQYHHHKGVDSEKVLTSLGIEQALLTGKRLKLLGKPYSVIIHSTMERAVQTAQLISDSLPDVPMKSCDLLREGAPAIPDPPVKHWRPKPHEFFRDSVRIEAAFRKHFHRADPHQKEDSYEIMVCHANVIRYFVCRALQLPPEAWLRMSLGNCSLTLLSIRPNGRVSLRSLGNNGHLPPELMTFS